MTNPVIDNGDYAGSPGAHGFVAILVDNLFKDDMQPPIDIVRYDTFVAALAKPMGSLTLDILHGAVGVSGEAGELLDSIKKTWVYNRAIDRQNIVEELGDLRFYIQVVMNTLGISEQEVIQENANKLSKRYKGIVYSDAAAIARADKTMPDA